MVSALTDGIHPNIRRERKREEMQKNKKTDDTGKGRKDVRA